MCNMTEPRVSKCKKKKMRELSYLLLVATFDDIEFFFVRSYST